MPAFRTLPSINSSLVLEFYPERRLSEERSAAFFLSFPGLPAPAMKSLTQCLQPPRFSLPPEFNTSPFKVKLFPISPAVP